MNEIYHFQKIFRDIEKATKKCVHLKGAIELLLLLLLLNYSYCYYYNYLLL